MDPFPLCHFISLLKSEMLGLRASDNKVIIRANVCRVIRFLQYFYAHDLIEFAQQLWGM